MDGRKVVIIAGAGTSVGFGLPSGEGMLTDLRAYKRDKWKYARGEEEPTLAQTLENFDMLMMAASNSLHNSFDTFHQTVERSFVPSIDLLADHRREYIELAKLWSARCLYQPLAQAESVCWRPTVPTPSGKDDFNWLAGVCRLYATNVNNIADFEPNDLTIVTFNYDPLIEIGIGSMLESSFPGIGKAQKLPRIIHVHGHIARSKKVSTAPVVAEQSRRIRFVHETKAQATELTEIRDARFAINAADTIYCLGFAFNAANVELLGLDGNANAEKTWALNYDGNAGLSIAMRTAGLLDKQIISGSTSAPLSVGRAVSSSGSDLLNQYLRF